MARCKDCGACWYDERVRFYKEFLCFLCNSCQEKRKKLKERVQKLMK